MTVANFDERPDAHYPVAVKVISITVADESTVKTETANINGVIKQIVFETGAMDGSDTAELTIVDSSSNTIYASGQKVESAVHVINVERAVAGLISFTVTCSAEQNDAAVAFSVTIYYV